jgi:hypothetical protein
MRFIRLLLAPLKKSKRRSNELLFGMNNRYKSTLWYSLRWTNICTLEPLCLLPWYVGSRKWGGWLTIAVFLAMEARTEYPRGVSVEECNPAMNTSTSSYGVPVTKSFGHRWWSNQVERSKQLHRSNPGPSSWERLCESQGEPGPNLAPCKSTLLCADEPGWKSELFSPVVSQCDFTSSNNSGCGWNPHTEWVSVFCCANPGQLHLTRWKPIVG